ncbi:dephospho-CoA kinase [Rhodoblastus acidophilus]|uniref:Dephospho-CoA kinase n=1 Tax=Candidatus Rhodoblastus alkanivorans TaxID=2954117 RepID=A0ABS9Z1L6_9HYPH|nr:dephospho-CoA kinase [Candidatus Rhodoblastus alkanivorans]MCI4678105.1 dephospho-CoA kinase [Candidatus Rhodoblastus alkanivorans]MCI4681554.1 dephospho-CoA kinase [Candidatus Rhodoblastus alkanivorans]MDI4642602.1 dephospho-CoA kinase [Rhodoblastus acidophilus]
MIVLGLTGSIGMGKSTTANLFRRFGIPVFDADQSVHRIYAGEPPEGLAERFPDAIVDGRIDRKRLAALVLHDSGAVATLEKIVHPMVAHARDQFILDNRREGAKVAVIDAPLLFETETWRLADAVVVVSAPEKIQRERVLSRDSTTEIKLNQILSRQMPDAEKKRRAQFIVHTQFGIEQARRQIRTIVATLAQIDK